MCAFVSVCDSMNYLECADDFIAVLKLVNNSLKRKVNFQMLLLHVLVVEVMQWEPSIISLTMRMLN